MSNGDLNPDIEILPPHHLQATVVTLQLIKAGHLRQHRVGASAPAGRVLCTQLTFLHITGSWHLHTLGSLHILSSQ